jgi:hypothetical protein
MQTIKRPLSWAKLANAYQCSAPTLRNIAEATGLDQSEFTDPKKVYDAAFRKAVNRSAFLSYIERKSAQVQIVKRIQLYL